ncbi:MAG: ABC transporter transmembrane domain-containing protein [Ardenticatenia bacterium]|nr:ABC transporter transmembrane domain-containing protein [Ardenticatenia bacterium]
MADEDVLGKAYDPHVMRRLLGYLAPHRRRIGAAFFFMAVGSAANVAGPVFIQRAIDQGLTLGRSDRLALYTLFFLGTALLEWVAVRLRVHLMAVTGTRVVCDVREELFAHLHTLSLSFYNRYAIGRLMSRLIGDVGVLQDFVTWAIVGVFRDLFLLGGTVVAMVALNWRLSAMTFLVLPLMAWSTNQWRRRMRLAYRVVRRRIAILNGYLNESITGFRVTAAFVRHAQNIRLFEQLTGLTLRPIVGQRASQPSSSPVWTCSAPWPRLWWWSTAGGKCWTSA